MNTRIIITLIFTLSMIGLLNAQEAIDMNDMVITANKIETSKDFVGSSVTVITSKDIKKLNVNSLVELLKNTQGITLTQNGHTGKTASVFIRGANSGHTAVLINGVRVRSSTDSAFDFSNINLDNIERIEILRGTQSSLFGADAIGGVINIITKKGKKGSSGSLSTEIGSQKYQKSTLTLQGGNDIFDYNTSLSYFNLGGFSAASERKGNDEEDDYKNTTFTTNLGVNFLGDGRIDAYISYIDDFNELDGFKADDLDYENDTKSLYLSLNIEKPITDWYTQKLLLGYDKIRSEGKDPTSSWNEHILKSTTKSIESQSNFFISDNDTLTLGLEYTSIQGENSPNLSKNKFLNRAIYLENQFIYDNLSITLSGRYDKHSDFESEATYRAALSYKLLESTRIHSSYGTGYKTPTINDIFYKDAFAVGNPDLKPEKSKSFDFGIEQKFFDNKAVFDLTYFYLKIKDMIIWNWWSVFPMTPQNLNNAKMQGLEANLSYKITDDIDTKIYYTFTDAIDSNINKELARRPRHNAGANINYALNEKLNINCAVNYIGQRYDDGDNLVKLGGYTTVDLAATYKINTFFEVYGRVYNLTNKQTDIVDGYGTLRRYGYLGLKYNF